MRSPLSQGLACARTQQDASQHCYQRHARQSIYSKYSLGSAKIRISREQNKIYFDFAGREYLVEYLGRSQR